MSTIEVTIKWVFTYDSDEVMEWTSDPNADPEILAVEDVESLFMAIESEPTITVRTT